MKKVFWMFLVILLIIPGVAFGYALDNQQLVYYDGFGWNVYFPNAWLVYTNPQFDLGADSTIDGDVFSGVVKSYDESLYSYFYRITVNYDATEVVTGMAFNWGPIAPVSFDYGDGNGVNDSWFGLGSDGWNAGESAPQFASYESDVVRWFYLAPSLDAGDQSAWMIVLSPNPPQLVDLNLIDGGPPEVTGMIYAPTVPEPTTLVLLGLGLVGIGVMRKKI